MNLDMSVKEVTFVPQSVCRVVCLLVILFVGMITQRDVCKFL